MAKLKDLCYQYFYTTMKHGLLSKKPLYLDLPDKPLLRVLCFLKTWGLFMIKVIVALIEHVKNIFNKKLDSRIWALWKRVFLCFAWMGCSWGMIEKIMEIFGSLYLHGKQENTFEFTARCCCEPECHETRIMSQFLTANGRQVSTK